MAKKRSIVCLSVAALGIIMMLMLNQTFAWLFKTDDGGGNGLMVDPFTGSVIVVVKSTDYLYIPGDDLASADKAGLEMLINYRVAEGNTCNMRLRAETKYTADIDGTPTAVITPCIDMSFYEDEDTDALLALAFNSPFTEGFLEDGVTYWYLGSNDHTQAAAKIAGTGAQQSTYNLIKNASLIGRTVNLKTGPIEIIFYLQIKQFDSLFPWTDVAAVTYRIP